MKDRLIEQLDTFCQKELGTHLIKDILDKFADHLLANGVIVPPCNVGDKVYVIEQCSCSHKYGERCSANRIRKNTKWLEIVKLPPTHHYTRCLKLFARPFRIEYLNRIGKTVFLTREEAEKALKRKEDGNADR